jgi:hypothetical protein
LCCLSKDGVHVDEVVCGIYAEKIGKNPSKRSENDGYLAIDFLLWKAPLKSLINPISLRIVNSCNNRMKGRFFGQRKKVTEGARISYTVK